MEIEPPNGATRPLLRDRVERFANRARDFIGTLLPPTCILCQQTHGDLSLVCRSCLDAVTANDAPCPGCAEPNCGGVRCGRCQTRPRCFDHTSAPLLFDGPLRELIHRWKFHNCQELSLPLGKLLAEHLPAPDAATVYVPIPLHWRRRWQRGFDQVWQLSNALALHQGRLHGLTPPILPLLQRIRHTRHQSASANSNRDDNVKGAFQLRTSPPGQKTLILIDDVLTTGATADAAANTIKTGGKPGVGLICLARAVKSAAMNDPYK